MVNELTTQPAPKRPIFRQTALKNSASIILFLIIAALAEYFVVLYAISLGTTDTSLVEWSFQFPGTNWPVTITISPLFHLVPIAVIITLAFSWIYMAKQVSARRQETQKRKTGIPANQGTTLKKLMSRISRSVKRFFGRIKSGFLKARGISYLAERISPARGSIRGAITVLFVFLLFAFVFSLLAYPQLIYWIVTSIYQNNSSVYNFVMSVNNSVKGFAEALSPIGWISTNINNFLLATAPGLRTVAMRFGSVTVPLASLDNAGKYLVFQNAAACLSVLAILIYGEYMRAHRYRRK